ncbi:hypothetical protein HanRHA438_Chr04g0168241 [Helianthus annuus]|nr:hypothetical protein HanIR_Chr04g0170571 [Helianthus annuus]KAJ0926193.1 hypothetical protein HanRHA438_Chr04g0168241 [Helianthus annuus]
MALRGKEETFVCRFAAGGNDGVPFNPRGYGNHSRRFAARGNEIVDHENFRESCDGYYPRRFAARGNEDPDHIYDSSPVFDEYEDDVWYAWATGGSYRCGFDEAVRLNENSLSPKITGMFAKFFYRDEIIIGGEAVTSGGDTVAKVGDEFIRWGEYFLGFPKFEPTTMEKSQILGSLINSKFQFKDDIVITKLMHISDDNKENYLFLSSLGAIKKDDDTTAGPNVKEDWDLNYACITSFLEKSPRGASSNKYGVVGLIKLVDTLKYGLSTNRNGVMDFGCPSVMIASYNTNKVATTFSIGIELSPETWHDIPFDPGGFGPKAKLEDEFSRIGGE